jgi:hypothetical protein
MLHKNYPPSAGAGVLISAERKSFKFSPTPATKSAAAFLKIARVQCGSTCVEWRKCVTHAFAHREPAAVDHGDVRDPARDPPGVPRRAGADRQSGGPLQRPALALEVEQEPADRLQGGGPRRGARRHHGDAQGGQRRELLRRAEELHGGDEEPGGEIQRFEVRRQERTRQELHADHHHQLGPLLPDSHLQQGHQGHGGRTQGAEDQVE